MTLIMNVGHKLKFTWPLISIGNAGKALHPLRCECEEVENINDSSIKVKESKNAIFEHVSTGIIPFFKTNTINRS